MKNNTCIVLLAVNSTNDRTTIEKFENYHFKTLQQAKEHFNYEGCEDFEIMPISDFMDLSNNEEFYAANYWLGYITIEETF